MPFLSSQLAQRVAVRHGVVSVAEMTTDGLGRNAIRGLVTAGSLIRCHQGVYRVATSADTFESRCAAACLADRSAVITGPAAARLWEFRHVWRAEQPIVMIEHDRTPLSNGVILRRTNVLAPEDVTVRGDGIRVASPSRAWFDCARDLDDARFERLTEWVLDHHASVPTLWRMRRRLDHRGRPGLARVNRVLSQRSAWQRPAGSGIELRVLRALERAGVGPIVRQHPLRLPDGVVIHPDGALPNLRWAVEVDHVTWHGGRLDAQRDKGRDRKLRRIGWQVDRVTDTEVRDSFDSTIVELLELIELRRSDIAA
jgi:hypothetical protein